MALYTAIAAYADKVLQGQPNFKRDIIECRRWREKFLNFYHQKWESYCKCSRVRHV